MHEGSVQDVLYPDGNIAIGRYAVVQEGERTRYPLSIMVRTDIRQIILPTKQITIAGVRKILHEVLFPNLLTFLKI